MKLMMRKRPIQAKRERMPLPRNVGTPERWISLAAGGAAVTAGVRRRGMAGAALSAAGGYLLFRGATGHCAVYGRLRRSTARPEQKGLLGTNELRVHISQVVDRPREMVYRYWRKLENLPNFMTHIEQVGSDGNRSFWIARGPLGMKVRWRAEITQDSPNERLAWRSVVGSDVENRGEVRFKPAGDGTELEVDMFYRLPGGRLGRWLGGISEKRVRRDLEQFKQMIERQASPVAAPSRQDIPDQGLGRATITPAHG